VSHATEKKCIVSVSKYTNTPKNRLVAELRTDPLGELTALPKSRQLDLGGGKEKKKGEGNGRGERPHNNF